MRLLFTVVVSLSAISSVLAQASKPCHNAGPARCDPYGICRACSTCSSCAYCKSGGRCSVCGGRGVDAPKASFASRRSAKRG